MIINTVCNSCLQSFELMIEPSERLLVEQIADDAGHTCPCPRLCGGRIFLVGDETMKEMAQDPRLKQQMRLSGKELYQAVLGNGLPDEIPRDPAVVESMLKGNQVTAVSVEQSGKFLYLHEIYLTNGVTLHLGSGPRGAHVLKMTKERTNGVPDHR